MCGRMCVFHVFCFSVNFSNICWLFYILYNKLYLLLVAVLLFQLSTRFRSNVDEKMRKLGYIGVGVSAVGQRLVDTITKTCVTLSAIFV